MSEDHATAIKRLRIRSWRRGTKEMDMILGPFSDKKLAELGPEEFSEYEMLLNENDQDLYAWFSLSRAVPKHFAPILNRIRQFHGL